MPKLIIQIPSYNEEGTLGLTLSQLPRELPGIEIEWLVIDDGSTDRTVEVARKYGADHILRLESHKGLARSFMAGLEACLRHGADIIVNTDADNQYCAADIGKLIEPILSGKADIVVGERPIEEMEHFSFIKKRLQKLGSWLVRLASKTNTPDAPSGFRAMSREAALGMNVFSNYTYTLETIIQAGQKGLTVTSVPVRTNEDARPSRLVKNIPTYILRSMATIVRIFVVYRPFRFFLALGVTLFTVGFLIGLRFLYYYFSGEGSGHIQSLVLAGVLLGFGFQAGLIAFVVDLLAFNRRLLEELQYRMRKKEDKRR